MKYISIINISFRILFIILIFFVVKNQNDYLYVPILTSLGYFFGGLYSIIFVLRKFPVSIIIPSKSLIFFELKDSFKVFISSLLTQGSRYFTVLMIGITFGDITLGIYSIVEKIYFTIMLIPSTISQTLFPYISRTKNITIIKKVLFFSIMSLIVLILFLPLIRNFTNTIFIDINSTFLSTLLIIMFCGSIFGFANILIGYPLLGAFGYIDYANKSLIYAFLFYAFFMFLFCLMLENIYLSVSCIGIFHFSSLIFRVYYLRKFKIL